MPSRRGGRSISRKDTPLSPPKSATATRSPRQTRRSTRSTSHGLDEDPDPGPVVRPEVLVPVEEGDEDLESEARNSDTGRIVGVVVESPTSTTSSDASSDLLGELEALDRDSILDNLADLYHDALKLLDSSTSAEDYPLNDSAKKKVSRALTRFTIAREEFGGQIFINPTLIARKLRNNETEEINEGPWRPDAALFMANLAQFYATICIGIDAQIEQILNYMLTSFPEPFCQSNESSRFDTRHAHEVFNLGLDIKTQLFINACKTHLNSPAFDPDDILGEAFINDAGEIQGSEVKLVDGFNLADIGADRMSEIREFFSTDSTKPVQLQQLETHYPWGDLVACARDFVMARRAELEAQIADDGGIDAIADLIQAGEFSVGSSSTKANAPNLGAAVQSKSTQKRATKPPTDVMMKRQIAQLKLRQAEHAARRSGAGLATSPQRESEREISRRSVEADRPRVTDDQRDVDPTQQIQLVLDVIKSQASQSNKENLVTNLEKGKKSLLDRQATAQKISFDSQDETPASPIKRRRAAESEASEEDDTDFEEDRRPAKKANTAKGKEPVRVHGQLLNIDDDPVVENNEEGQDDGDDGQAEPSTSITTKRVSSTLPTRKPLQPLPMKRALSSSAPTTQSPRASQAPDSNQTLAANADDVKAKAKELVRANRYILPPDVQVRKPYSAEEVARLIYLVAQNGTRWAKMLVDDTDVVRFPDGPVLQNRTQVQLKDKARNIKLDYLKARQPLPHGFEHVSVGKSMIEKLRSMGVSYVEGDERAHSIGEEDGDEE